MNKFWKYFWAFVVVAILGYGISCIIGSFLETGSITVEGIMGGYSWGIWALIMVAFILYILVQAANGKSMFKSSDKKKKDGKKPTEQFFDSEWLTEQELNKKYDGCFFRDLHSHKDGVPIRAQAVGNNVKVNLLHEVWHTMIVGTTGSGKTAGYISPTIQILASTSTKPSLVIMDVKGELYNMHGNKLKDEGYTLVTFDLRNPYSSTRWNPMYKPYKNYQRALNLRKEVIVHRNENPADCGLRVISPVYDNEWYEFEGVAFPNRDSIESQLTATRKGLIDSAFEDLNDIAMSLSPVSEGTNDASWQQGAKDFILGTMLAMLEDSADPRLNMTAEKYNFFNLYKICNVRDADPDRQFGSLQKYFEGRGPMSNATTLAGPIVNNAPGTTRSYFGMVSNAVNVFADSGVCFATSADEIDFEHFADKPTALFIKVPDEKETRHPIAQMCVLQMYKTLVEVASRTPKLELPRHVYFILDEFANMPKIPRFESIVTVGRSRGIALMLVVQSYRQVEIKYGEAAADVIKSNCNVHVYLGTEDQKTKEEFSARCGQTSVEAKSTSESKSKQDTTKSTNVQRVSRALITPDELGYLKKGEMIVSMFKEKALKSEFTFAYKVSNVYNMKPMNDDYVIPRFINEDQIYYDIRQRNKLVLSNNNFNF